MAYPVVESSAVTETAADGTSHTVTMPSGIVAGDLLLAFLTVDGGSTTTFTHSGWRRLAEVDARDGTPTLAKHLLLVRRAGGSDTLTVTTSASEAVSAVVYRVSGASGLVEVQSNRTTTPDAAPNGPSTAPSWGAADTLWIASAGWDIGSTALSAYPSGWSGSQVTARWSSANGTGTAVCTLTSTNTSENPPTFTLGASQAWAAFTVAVQPSTGGIVYVGNGGLTATATAGGTTNPPLPPDWKVDDLAVLVLGARFQSTFLPTEPSVSAGWTKRGTYAMYQIGSGQNSPYVAIYTRVLQSGDTAPTVTNVNDSGLTNEATYSVVLGFDGVDTTTPVHVAPVGSDAVAASTFTPTGLTTTVDGALTVSVVGTADDNALALSSAQGFTLLDKFADTTGNDMAIGVAAKEIVTAGAVTCPTWEQTSLGPDHWAAMSFALTKAVSASPQSVSPSGIAPSAALGAPDVWTPAIRLVEARVPSAFGVPSWGTLHQAGDVAVFVASLDPPSTTASLSGWTEIACTSYVGTAYTPALWAAYRVLDGSESGSVGTPTPDVGSYTHGHVLVFRGVDNSTVVDVVGAEYMGYDGGSLLDISGLTTTVDDTLVLALLVGAVAQDLTFNGTGYTVGHVRTSASRSSGENSWFKYKRDAGSESAVTVTPSTGTANWHASFSVALRSGVPAQSVSPTGLADGQGFGAPSVAAGAVTVAPAGLTDPPVFGAPTVTPGAVSVSPPGLAATAAVGAPAATLGAVTVSPAGVASTAAVGAASASPGAVAVSSSGVGSTAAFGAPSVTTGHGFVYPVGAEPTAGFGAPSVIVPNLVWVYGVETAARVGQPSVGRAGVNTRLALRTRYGARNKTRSINRPMRSIGGRRR